jgi:hypothetical protein
VVLALLGMSAFAWKEYRLQSSGMGRFGAGIAAAGFIVAAVIVTYGLFS